MNSSSNKKSLATLVDEKAPKIPVSDDHEAELANLFDRMSSASLKALLFDTVKSHPELIRKWYKNTDSEENMDAVIREKVEKANLEIENATRLDVDLFSLGQQDAWWKDASRIEEMKIRLESREHNEGLNVAVQQLMAVFGSNLLQTQAFLDRGLFELAAHCFKLIVALYMETRASKDGFINQPEEVAFVDFIIYIEGSFVHGVSIPIGVVDDVRLLLHRLAPNLVHESNIARLTKHLKPHN